MAERVSQEVVETVYSPSRAKLRASQVVMEVAYTEGAGGAAPRFSVWWWD